MGSGVVFWVPIIWLNKLRTFRCILGRETFFRCVYVCVGDRSAYEFRDIVDLFSYLDIHGVYI
jgi:hypothetical protein